MLNRRQFSKFIFTGAVFVPLTGIIRPSSANWWAHQGVSSRWANWDESSEASLASDDIFVALFEGGIGTSEIGLGGGLSEANRTLDDATNDIAGVSGGYRQLVAASSQLFNWPTAASTLMIKNQADFTIIIKTKDWTTVASAADPILKWDTTNFFITSSGATKKLNFVYNPTAGGSNVTSTNAMSETGVIYFAIWRKDGAVKAAFKETIRPIKESDFAAGDTCESTQDGVYDRTLAHTYLFSDAARWATIKAGYIVVAKKALFS